MKALNAMDNRLLGIESLLTRQQSNEQPPPPPRSEQATDLNTPDRGPSRYTKTPEANMLDPACPHGSTTDDGGTLDWCMDTFSTENLGGVDWTAWTQVHQDITFPGAFPTASSNTDPQGSPNSPLIFSDMGMDGPNVVDQHGGIYGAPEASSHGFDVNNTLQPSQIGRPMESKSFSQTGKRPDSFEQVIQDPDDDITQQLANRFGRLQLAEDGHLRYYGATSHLHMMSQEPGPFYQPSRRPLRDEEEAAVERAGLHWAQDEAYESHLTRLYFAWHNPWVNEVDQQIYLREKSVYDAGRDTPLYTPALNSAVLAMGAFYSMQDHPAIEERPSDFFAARTRTFLEIEMDSPTLATTQAAIILSAHEAANGRDSRAWVYSGMAVQMATDLGLHLNMKLDAKYLDVNTEIERVIALRNQIFWVVYASNTYHAAYNGRPGLMNKFSYNTPAPTPWTSYEWEPYIEANSQVPLPSGLNVEEMGLVSAYVTQLAMKSVRISEVLYSGVSNSLESANTLLSAMSKELEQWRATLPAALQISADQVPLPMTYQLHMVYHQTMIFLYRPFISEANETASLAVETCSSSAREICRLLGLYRRHYSLSRINVHAVALTMTAGIVHAYDSCVFSGSRGKIAEQNLLDCINALSEMGQSFNSAVRGIEVITSRRRIWRTQNFVQAGVKRHRGTFSQPSRPQMSARRESTNSAAISA